MVVAARRIANRGVSTFVETTVAIELAVSWNPLMYSKINAARMTVKRRVMRPSGILEYDMVDDVPRIAAPVYHLLEQVVQVL